MDVSIYGVKDCTLHRLKKGEETFWVIDITEIEGEGTVQIYVKDSNEIHEIINALSFGLVDRKFKTIQGGKHD